MIPGSQIEFVIRLGKRLIPAQLDHDSLDKQLLDYAMAACHSCYHHSCCCSFGSLDRLVLEIFGLGLGLAEAVSRKASATSNLTCLARRSADEVLP